MSAQNTTRTNSDNAHVSQTRATGDAKARATTRDSNSNARASQAHAAGDAEAPATSRGSNGNACVSQARADGDAKVPETLRGADNNSRAAGGAEARATPRSVGDGNAGASQARAAGDAEALVTPRGVGDGSRGVAARARAKVGRVVLVGAGPGDPELLTLRGARELAQADVVLHDALVAPALLTLVPARALLVDVGRRGHVTPARTQDDINALLLAHARAGKTVVRLKGGDPYVFGRGGEEASACALAGVRCDVVPGISSAQGALAYAGVPVTDRRCAASFAVVSGHRAPARAHAPEKLAALARSADTLVVLMGLGNLAEWVAQLLAGGCAPDTPAAAVHRATTPAQRSVRATLARLPEAAARAGLRAPTVIVVGAVAGLPRELAWFERLPLFGRRVLVTRRREQAGALTRALASAGAEAVLRPMIQTTPLREAPALGDALAALASFDLVVLSSANAAREFAARAHERGVSLAALRAPVFALGHATARAAREAGFASNARENFSAAPDEVEHMMQAGVNNGANEVNDAASNSPAAARVVQSGASETREAAAALGHTRAHAAQGNERETNFSSRADGGAGEMREASSNPHASNDANKMRAASSGPRVSSDANEMRDTYSDSRTGDGAREMRDAYSNSRTDGGAGEMRETFSHPHTFTRAHIHVAGPDAEGLLRALLARGGLAGRRVLLPRAAGGRAVLARGLRRAGARVTEVPVYRTEPAPFDARALCAQLEAGEFDALTFASPSAVRSFARGAGAAGIAAARRVLVATIGEQSAAACRAAGLAPGVIAARPEAEALTRALEKHFQELSS